jgi:hypothetical protein
MSAQRKGARIGFGDRVPIEGNIVARRLFLEAFARHAQPAMCELAALARAAEYHDDGYFDVPSELALRRWSETYGFPYGDPFWTPHLRTHLRHWQIDPKSAGQWAPVFGWYRPLDTLTLQGKAIENRLAPWEAASETWETFAARVEAHRAAVEADERSVAAPIFELRDFDALVLEHVTRKPIAAIMETTGERDEKTLRRRNVELAAVLKLKLQRRSPGRPRKTRI